jgi:hypothetical protein
MYPLPDSMCVINNLLEIPVLATFGEERIRNAPEIDGITKQTHAYMFA